MSVQIVCEAEDIGVDHAQYFRGRGTSWTNWDHVFVGTGNNAHEALEDAMNQAAMSLDDDIDWEKVTNPYPENAPIDPNLHTDNEDSELYYYAAFWVRVVEEPRDGGQFGGGDRIDCGDGMARSIDSVDYDPETQSWVIEDWAHNAYRTAEFRIEDNQVFWIAAKIRDWSERNAS